MALLWSNLGWGQSYLGLNGGFEGSATIDNTVQASAQANKWTKNNATQTIADETTVVRSGAHSLSATNSSATGRRVWSPLMTVSSTTSQVTIQFYRRTSSTTNNQESMGGVGDGTTSGDLSSGTYAIPSPANTFQKVTYTRASWTYTNIAGVITTRMNTAAGMVYIDDVCMYAGAVDNTVPDSPTASSVGTPTTSSLTVGWTAPGTGIDNGGYLVVRGTSDPTTAPNVNGIYAVGNTIAAGMTVVYNGTGTSFTDNGLSASTTYYYRIYTYDKAYNYSAALTGNGTTSAGGSPTLSVSALTDFGSQCINSTYGPNSFTITGSSLTAANVTVAALSGFTFSTTSGGTYTSTLSLTQGGGAYSQTIYVKFSPIAVQSYNGNVVVGGGGASNVNCATTGIGINTTPTISTPTSTSITSTTATLGGNITAIGCTNVSERGIYWSTTNGFADGTGTKVSETPGPYSTGVFTEAVTGLPSGTVIYFKAFALSASGTVYTTQANFTTYKAEPTNHPTAFTCGTTTSSTIPLTWADASGGTTPDGYLILWNTSGTFTDPVDGTAQADGAGVKNITQGTQAYTATGLAASTTYYFKIWPYTNSGTNINYKTAATVSTTNCATTTVSYPCTLTEGFESGLPTSYPASQTTYTLSSGDWSLLNTMRNSTDQHGGTYCAQIHKASGENATTPSLSNLGTMTFWCKAGSVGSNGLKIQKSISGGAFTDVQTFTITTTNTQYTCYINDASSDIKIRFLNMNVQTLYLDDVNASCFSIKPEPTNYPTSFTCGTTTSSTIPLTWTDATGTTTPDGYLIKWSTTSYAAITAPADGTAEADGTDTKNITQGTHAYTPSGLSPATTYYFKIWSYTNSNTTIDYKTSATEPQTTCTTQSGACLAESFEGTYPPAGWTNSGTSQKATGGCDGAKQVIFDGAGDYLITPPLSYPSLLTFQYKRSSDATAWSVKIQYCATVGGTYTDITTISGATTSCQLATVALPAGCSSLSTVYLKILDTRSTGANERYIDDVNVFCSMTACTAPTAPATVLTFTAIDNTSITLNWTNGDGSRRIVIARESSAVNFTPVSNTSYSASSDFSAATALDGNGNKAVYSGTGSSATITGLSAGTTYYFAIYEYNCTSGMEQYYTTSPATGNQMTKPNPVTNLNVDCQTSTTAVITWTPPDGNYDGVIIGVRNSTLDCHTISSDASTYTANTVFGNVASQYGSTAPYSYVVYKGTGTTVSVTGLTAGQPYKIMAYTFKNTTGSIWSPTSPTTSITSLGTPDVTSLAATPLNASVQVSWVNPSGACWDEVMVVAKATSAVTTAPSGDGSAYSANAAFTSGTAYNGGYVVYKGNSNNVTVTGLTNGTSYCFKVYTRAGTTWSGGVYDCASPLAGTTTFVPGSIAVLGVNSNTYSCGVGVQSGDDEISIVTFQDIYTGTSLDMTDNGWEKCSAGKWGNVEGYMRIRYTGATTIPAGTVLTFRLNQGSGVHFTMIQPAAYTSWVIDIEDGPLIFNTNGDQIYFMQGGTWNPGTPGSNDATYTGGTFLFAFNTNNTWTAGICSTANNSSGTGRSQNSGLLIGMECFNMVPMVATDYLKYVGDMTSKSQRDWISYIKDGDNWSSYTGCATYNANGYDYLNTVHSIGINTSGSSYVPGLWTGGANTDWFQCDNWDNLRVPDKTVNVTLPAAGVLNSCTIGAPGLTGQPSAHYTEASSNNLTNSLSGYTFSINNSSSKLDIWGNFSTNSNFSHTAGLVTFKGTTAQTHTGVATFYNLTLNNSSGLTLNNNISIASGGTLTTTSGILTTQSANTIDLGSGGTIVEGASSTAPTSYVTGNVKATRNIGSSTNQTFGGMGLELTETGAVNSTVVIRTTGTAITVPSGNQSIKRYFDITPTTNSGLSATMIFHYFDHELNGLTETDLELFKAPGPAYSAFTAQQGTINAGLNTSTKSGISSFSRWTLASKNLPLPVELMRFEAACNNTTITLSWTTSSETNNDYFTIEKSTDSKTWKVVAKIDGGGNTNSTMNYNYSDVASDNNNVYYRLKQTDYNGQFVYYDPVVIKCDDVDQFINLYPNPASGQTICSLYSEAQETVNVEITSYLGSVIYKNNFNTVAGFNLLTLDISGYQTGVYTVIVRSSDGNILGYKQLVIN